MPTAEACINRIHDVRAAASDYQSAYLLRTRLYRMVLSVRTLVASEIGIDVRKNELLPSAMETDSERSELTLLCNSLLLESKALAERSAALDGKWQQGWNSLQSQLDLLESLLRARPSQESV